MDGQASVLKERALNGVELDSIELDGAEQDGVEQGHNELRYYSTR